MRSGPRQPKPGAKERAKDMLALLDAGMTYEAVGERYGLTRQRVWNIVRLAKRARVKPVEPLTGPVKW